MLSRGEQRLWVKVERFYEGKVGRKADRLAAAYSFLILSGERAGWRARVPRKKL